MWIGVVSMLVALAVVGVLVSRQLQAVRASASAVPSAAAAAAATGVASGAASGAASPSPAAVARQLADDVNQRMQQAPARIDSAY